MAKSKRGSNAAVPPAAGPVQGSLPSSSAVSRVADRLYRFLASLKLAVVSLLTLAAVLAYATGFETRYGTTAVQEVVYKSWWFALLLAFLGMNILCAATIRYPWKKRQIGFLVTHAGLLTVLVGSWISVQATYDGQAGMVEGDVSSELVQFQRQRVWVQPVDSESGEPKGNVGYKLTFEPGSFSWENESREEANRTPRQQRLTSEAEPFQLEILNYHAASTPLRLDPEPGVADGVPMLRASLWITPPNSDARVDMFENADDGTGVAQWLQAAHPRYRRAARDLGQTLVTFQYAENSELVDDFLSLPDKPLEQDLVRLHYTDDAQAQRVFDWVGPFEAQASVALPDSNLKVTIRDQTMLPLGPLLDHSGEMAAATADSALPFIVLDVQAGDAEPQQYVACASLPALPSKMDGGEALVRVGYYHPPTISSTAMQGRASVVDLMGTPDGKLYYRALSRDGLRGKGPLPIGAEVALVEKSIKQPVGLDLKVWDYFPSAGERFTCDDVELAANQRDSGIPAALIKMTVGEKSREFWLRRGRPEHDMRSLFRAPFDFLDEDGDGRDDRHGHSPRFETIRFDDDTAYRVALDMDRRDLGFSVALQDFEVEMDRGFSQQPAGYRSDVLLDDPSEKVVDEAHTISMNRPLTWKSLTFYQSSYTPVMDPQGRETGQFMSIFQVRYDPPWCWGTIYMGCLLVTMGIFVQFYMRAGVFSRMKTMPSDAAAASDTAEGQGRERSAPVTALQAASSTVDQPGLDL